MVNVNSQILAKSMSLLNGLNDRLTNSCARNSWIVTMNFAQGSYGSKLKKYAELLGCIMSTNTTFVLISLITISFGLLKEIAIKVCDLIKGLIVLYQLNVYLFHERSTDFWELLNMLCNDDNNFTITQTNWFEQVNETDEDVNFYENEPMTSANSAPPPPYSSIEQDASAEEQRQQEETELQQEEQHLNVQFQQDNLQLNIQQQEQQQQEPEVQQEQHLNDDGFEQLNILQLQQESEVKEQQYLNGQVQQDDDLQQKILKQQNFNAKIQQHILKRREIDYDTEYDESGFIETYV